jgi:hypothetical protein
MYKLSAYYLARSAADVPIELLNTLLFVIVTYWFGGLQRDAGCFFGTLFSLLLVVLVAEAWGLLVGAVFFNPKDGQVGGWCRVGVWGREQGCRVYAKGPMGAQT